jgi:hypothetical protein
MEVNGQLHAPAALSTGKEPLIPIVYEVGWTPEPMWTLWSTETSLAPPGKRTPVVQPVAGNIRYHSIQNHLSSCLLCNIWYGCETLSLALWQEYRLYVFETRVIMKLSGAKRKGGRRNLRGWELHNFYSSSNVNRMIEWSRMRWTGQVARLGMW